MRGTMSLITFVCDDDQVQRDLPQILLIKKHFAPQATRGAIHAAVQPPVAAWIVENSWMTSSMMVRVLQHLANSLRRWKGTHQIILSMDAYRAHISQAVWRKAAALNIMCFVIPAKLTWALQPCDTHVFAKLKHHLSCLVHERLVQSPDGKPTVLMVVDSANRAVQAIVTNGDWRRAFWDLGLTGEQTGMSETCLHKLDLAVRPEIPNSLPSLAGLLAVFPGRTNLPIDDIFRIFINRARQQPACQNRPESLIAQPCQMQAAQPWLGRLRSSSAQGSQGSAAAALPEACPQAKAAVVEPPPMLSPPPHQLAVPRARRLLPWLRRPEPPPSRPE